MTAFYRVLPAVARVQGDHEAPLHKIVVTRLDRNPGISMWPVQQNWKGIRVNDGPIVWLSPDERDRLVAMLTQENEQ